MIVMSHLGGWLDLTPPENPYDSGSDVLDPYPSTPDPALNFNTNLQPDPAADAAGSSFSWGNFFDKLIGATPSIINAVNTPSTPGQTPAQKAQQLAAQQKAAAAAAATANPNMPYYLIGGAIVVLGGLWYFKNESGSKPSRAMAGHGRRR